MTNGVIDPDAPPQLDFLVSNGNGGFRALGGQQGGSVASVLLNNNFDTNGLRPWIGEDGNAYITRNIRGVDYAVPITNANTFSPLPKDTWVELDEAMLKVARPRLRLFNDLRDSGMVYTIPNGMGKTVLQSQRMTDMTGASVTIDGVTAADSDRVGFDLQSLPLPIIHKDFQFDLRQVAASRDGGAPLDTTQVEVATDRVAQMVEMLTLGTVTGMTFGGGTIYGYTNYPGRITGSLTYAPTNASWTPLTTVTDVLAMRSASMNVFHYGPWRLYHGQQWAQYMDQDYIVVSGSGGSNISGLATKTLRERLRSIEGIISVDQADFLHTGYDLILVQQSSSVARAVVGMDFTTLQWETIGGLMLNFKVMCIMIPQLRSDIYGQTGIVHYS